MRFGAGDVCSCFLVAPWNGESDTGDGERWRFRGRPVREQGFHKHGMPCWMHRGHGRSAGMAGWFFSAFLLVGMSNTSGGMSPVQRVFPVRQAKHASGARTGACLCVGLDGTIFGKVMVADGADGLVSSGHFAGG